jgi:flagellar biosynthesis protein FlhA
MLERMRWRDLIFPVGIISGILVVLVPLPPVILDVLLAANITLAVIILLTTIHVRTPLEFSIFPSLLLATTLGRLVLNIASTRLILTEADTQGVDAAGGVIRSFGDFVTGDSLVVGLVIFSILVIIQFLVITRGATRISEVAARFALDGMPGRQMAIDADLQAGSISNQQAQTRREQLTDQAEFYGAMDGASKFVRGDAIAAIIITLINIVGGLVIGVLQSGMSLAEATSIFTRLTIGDGLASQVPAFLVALAAAMLVTRSTRESNLSSQFLRQLFSRPQVLLIAASFLAILVLTDLPAVPLLTLAAGCGAIAIVMSRQNEKNSASRPEQESDSATKPQVTRSGGSIEDYLQVDPLEVEIGLGLIRLADPLKGGDLMDRITGIRRQVASEIGLLLPKVRVRDNLKLANDEYQIKIANNRIDNGQLAIDHLLVVDDERAESLPGKRRLEPGSQRPVRWISLDQRERAEKLGLSPLEPTEVLANHLRQVVLQHADELLTRDATQHLLDQLRRTSPVVVDELLPEILSTGQVQAVLQILLREGLPVRPLGVILEALADGVQQTSETCWLAEQARQRMARTICQQLWGSTRHAQVVRLAADLEQQLLDLCRLDDSGLQLDVPAADIERCCRMLADQLSRISTEQQPTVLLVSPSLRPIAAQLLHRELPGLQVISTAELVPHMHIETVETIGQQLTSMLPSVPVPLGQQQGQL